MASKSQTTAVTAVCIQEFGRWFWSDSSVVSWSEDEDCTGEREHEVEVHMETMSDNVQFIQKMGNLKWDQTCKLVILKHFIIIIKDHPIIFLLEVS
jgi:hypothetical protein